MSVYPEGVEIRRGAVLSECGRYRYRLTRSWLLERDRLPLLLPFVMLNPSTADAEKDDPTIRKCVGFARRLGFEGIAVYNLYAYRATKPVDLWLGPYDIVGPDNDRRLRNLFLWASGMAQMGKPVPVIAAWGTHARDDRVREVLKMPGALSRLHVLGLSKHGAPRHPLYLRSDSQLTPFQEAL